MRPQPLRERIVGALRLQPMTLAELAEVLTCSHSGVEHVIRDLREEGCVRPHGTQRYTTKRRIVWRIA